MPDIVRLRIRQQDDGTTFSWEACGYTDNGDLNPLETHDGYESSDAAALAANEAYPDTAIEANRQ